ncbi:MAG TPA: hypothetical protein VLK89_01625 [Solirubrobacterales bacterium]|nr:hypothetical protein [Solirubrobacterales bacterium]
MEEKPDVTSRQIARLARVAWLLTFGVPLVLAMLLMVVNSAHALPPVSVSAPAEQEEEFEGEEEGEFDEEACEVAEEEFEEGFLDEKAVEKACEEGEDRDKVAGHSSIAPAECLLRSAHARLVTSDLNESARLTIGYTTYEPTTATIDYGLSGGKGTLHLGAAKRHLGRSGVIRLSKALSNSEMAKLDAAGHFTVRLHVAEAPARCRRFETEQLTVRSASGHRVVWSQTG